MVERLPARYNMRSELTAEVVVGRINRYHFELTSGEAPATR
jgi:hypothetical protein